MSRHNQPCSGQCADCGEAGRLYARGRCRACYRRLDSGMPCRQCGRPRPPGTGGYQLCPACYTRQPERVTTWIAGRLALPGTPGALPGWFMVFAAELAEGCNPTVAFKHLRRLEWHLHRQAAVAPTATPTALVAALRADPTPGVAATATLLTEFLHRQGLGRFDDHAARLHARRQQHLARLPDRLRPAVEAFIDHLLGQQRRAAAYGIRSLTDRTITKQLLTLVTLAGLLKDRRIGDWASVTTDDI